MGLICPLGTFCPLGRLVPWDVLSLGRFVPWDVLSLETFRPLGRFVPWDVLSLENFVLGHFVLGRFACASTFVPPPLRTIHSGIMMYRSNLIDWFLKLLAHNGLFASPKKIFSFLIVKNT